MLFVLGNNLSRSFRDYFNAVAATRTDFKPLSVSLDQFRSREPFAEPLNDPAGQDVVVFQSTAGDVSAHCMSLLLATRTLKRHGAKTVTVVMPFAAFARQDKIPAGRFFSLAADDFPMLLKAAGADKIITAEVHSKKAEQFYVDHFGADNVTFISSSTLFADDIRAAFGAKLGQAVIGAPDGGDKPQDSAQIRAREITANVHGLPALSDADQAALMVKIRKTHIGVNATKVLGVEGQIAGRTGILIDDMSDTGGTILNGAEALKENGATEVVGYLSHGLCDLRALEDILTRKTGNTHTIDQLVMTDSAPAIYDHIQTLKHAYPDVEKRIRVLPTAPLFANSLKLIP